MNKWKIKFNYTRQKNKINGTLSLRIPTVLNERFIPGIYEITIEYKRPLKTFGARYEILEDFNDEGGQE